MNRGTRTLRDVAFTADAGLQAVLPHGAKTILPIARVGFTQPIAIYERMQALYANAQHLDADMVYVSDPAFVAGWRAWLAAYRLLYEKYAGPNASNTAKVLVLWRTDEFSQEIAKRESEFQSWLVDYNRQQKPDGSAVPQVQPLADPSSGARGWGIPWWFWVMTGVAVVGAGYLVHKKYQEGKAKKKYLEDNVLPKFLDTYIPGFGKEAVGYSKAGRDYSEGDAPHRFDLDYYAQKAPRRDTRMSSDVIDRYRGDR